MARESRESRAADEGSSPHLLRQVTVDAWMTRDPLTTEAGAAALAALEQMQAHGVRHLPVTEGDRELVGVVSLHDLATALPFETSLARHPSPAEREAAREEWVGDVMSYAPRTVAEGDSLEEAAERMAEARIGCLPVLDAGGRLVGILSETDLLRALATLLRPGGAPGGTAAHDAFADLVRELEGERDRLVQRLEELHEAEQRVSTDTGQPRDLGDRAADERAVASQEELDRLASRRLDAIQEALQRAGEGRLGVCRDCGGRIAVARLRAMPGATRCIECARKAGEAGRAASQ